MEEVKIGLYSIGLKRYWEQFEGLRERLVAYNGFIAEKIGAADGGAVCNFGLVDDDMTARVAGEYFNRQNVDIIFIHCATYAVSSTVLPVHQRCNAPVIILNLQPSIAVNYEKTTIGEWLAHCNACVIPELCNMFNRAGIRFELISGLLGLSETPAVSLTDEKTDRRPEAHRAWREIHDWVQAAGVKSALKPARFGFLGNFYSGMLDMYTDFTVFSSKTGIYLEILEMCDLRSELTRVTAGEIEKKRQEIASIFEISEDSPAEPLAKRPTKEQLTWSARVAAAQERLVKAYRLDALAYYYHSRDNNEYEALQGGLIVGNSLLTAKHVPCAGEADIKTALAMKICDLLNVGGSFCEIVTTDYNDGTILIGHDGPFHIRIAEGKPILRGMGVYHGKRGTGVSVEAKVKTGAVTTLGICEAAGGKLKAVISEGYSTDGAIMRIGNTQTPVRFSLPPDLHMETWFKQAPTHHFALSVGHNAALLEKVLKLLDIEFVVV
jgi:L-arabinose isomerase